MEREDISEGDNNGGERNLTKKRFFINASPIIAINKNTPLNSFLKRT